MVRVILVSTISVLIAGCGSSGPDVAVGQVEGVVTVDGQPRGKVGVTFVPVKGGGAPSSGETDENGRYTLTPTVTEQGMASGTVVGEYQVMISTERFPEYDDNSPDPISDGSPETIAPQFNSATTLKATVKEGENKLDFQVTSKKERRGR